MWEFPEHAVDGPSALASATTPLQAVDPVAVIGAAGPRRGAVAFALVLVLGGALYWRWERFVDRAIEASVADPLRSLVYGAAGHAVIVFGGVYLTSRLARLEVGGLNAGAVGVISGLFVMLLVAALGFTVVGSSVVALGWDGSRWTGIGLGALVAGVAASVDPLVGGIAWFAVVSTGIGGPVRRWVHASAGPGP